MSQEWIKVCKETPDKLEVGTIAETLGLARCDVFTRLFRLWSWADTHTVDGFARGATTLLVDELVGAAGFAQAMIAAGWLSQRSGGLQFPNFDRHMSKSAKKRALHVTRAKRSKAHPKRTPSSLLLSTSGSSSLPKEEKASPLKADGFEEFWAAYPRKAGKGAARGAWAKAITKAPVETIIGAAQDFAQSPLGRSGDQYVKHPATWLNAECWTDDRATWKRDDAKPGISGKMAGREAVLNFGMEDQVG